MKNPNGYGTVIKLSGKRRKPWAAVVTIGFELKEGEDYSFIQKREYVGYAATRKEALDLLTEYHAEKAKAPENAKHKITIAEIWEMWCNKNFKDGEKTAREYSYRAAFKKIEPLHDKYITDIKLEELENLMLQYEKKSRSTYNNIKTVLNFIYAYATKYEYTEKNYAQYLDNSTKKQEGALPIPKDVVTKLWKDTEKYKIILMYLYTGCRAKELLNLKLTDIHLDEKYFHISESKTPAGVRDVPIADKILPFFKEFAKNASATKKQTKLFDNLTYPTLRNFFLNDELLSPYTPHSCRHSFISMMTVAGVDERILQQIVGHAGENVTQKVYTHIPIKDKLKAVNKI